MTKIIDFKRHERKFIFKYKNHLEIMNILAKSNFFFNNQYPNRKVNSIYFDTNNLKNINENLDGISERKKFRVRWYGDEFIISNPVFEIKHKKNFETHKKSFPLKSFQKFELTDQEKFLNFSGEIKDKFFLNSNYIPTTMISYDRIYLISNSKKIRATIDYNIKSKKLIHFKENFFRGFADKILEIKYPTNIDEYVRENIHNINLRLMKSSKYINYSLFGSNLIS